MQRLLKSLEDLTSPDDMVVAADILQRDIDKETGTRWRWPGTVTVGKGEDPLVGGIVDAWEVTVMSIRDGLAEASCEGNV